MTIKLHVGALSVEQEDALMAAVIQSLQDTNLTGNPNQTARPAVPAVRNRTAEAGEGRENSNLIGAISVVYTIYTHHHRQDVDLPLQTHSCAVKVLHCIIERFMQP